MTYRLKSKNYLRDHGNLNIVQHDNELLIMMGNSVMGTISLKTIEENGSPTHECYLKMSSIQN